MFSFNRFFIPVAVGASLLLAACGSSSNNSSSNSSSSSASSAGSGLTIGTAKASVGTYLTGAAGRALYIWVADSNGKSSCFGGCAKAWPPLMASSMPKVAGGAQAADISLITRAGGSKQVAYKGRPLYYYAGDTGSGTTNGQGSNQFGAKWWLLSPAGSQVVHSSGGGATTSSSGGGWG